MSDYDRRRLERHTEERQYHADVAYAVWRSGGNMDSVDYERTVEHCQQGIDADHAARIELRLQRPQQTQEPEPEPPAL
jgi:hypothetical protein